MENMENTDQKTWQVIFKPRTGQEARKPMPVTEKGAQNIKYQLFDKGVRYIRLGAGDFGEVVDKNRIESVEPMRQDGVVGNRGTWLCDFWIVHNVRDHLATNPRSGKREWDSRCACYERYTSKAMGIGLSWSFRQWCWQAFPKARDITDHMRAEFLRQKAVAEST